MSAPPPPRFAAAAALPFDPPSLAVPAPLLSRPAPPEPYIMREPVMSELTPAPPFFPLPATPAPPPPPPPSVAEAPTPPRRPAPLVPPFAVFPAPPRPRAAVMVANCEAVPALPPTSGQLATLLAPPAPTATV